MHCLHSSLPRRLVQYGFHKFSVGTLFQLIIFPYDGVVACIFFKYEWQCEKEKHESFALCNQEGRRIREFGEQLYQDIYIHNNSHHGSVCINVVSTLAERNRVRVEGSKEFILAEGESRCVSVQYKPTCVGCMWCVLIVKVESEASAFEPLSISRYILVRAGNPEDDGILKPTSPFQKKNLNIATHNDLKANKIYM
jgi:hypothetical protein